jgi:hypothetical protein
MGSEDSRPVKEARIIRVIQVVVLRGNGTSESPYRDVYQYWSLDGEFLAEDDPHGMEGGDDA